MARIVEVFEEYKRIAERPDIAGQFLLKVFGREEIAEAAKCRGVDIPLELEPTCEPVEVSAPSIDAAPL